MQAILRYVETRNPVVVLLHMQSAGGRSFMVDVSIHRRPGKKQTQDKLKLSDWSFTLIGSSQRPIPML